MDRTEFQSPDERLRAQALSLSRSQPPVEAPGYDVRRLLGCGAFGEVWVAIDRTTGRQVAIKFYAHRGGLDWSLLSREVEKLAFLSADRYVVQLLDVGWESEPPYYVMEYVERGSLEERIERQGKLPVVEAVTIFRDIAIGLLHAHAKGILHCDLKPANVLLDEESKPRLADFGQSRLTHEHTPALGTLFYMAPEQADLHAIPDVRWDVYALGALLYCMLTGAPPHRNGQLASQVDTAADLGERLGVYRQVVQSSPAPAAHRHVAGIDRALVELIDGCLAADPRNRFGNVQEVLDALDQRQQRRARLPFMILGAVGPALVLLVMSLYAWRSFDTVVNDSDEALRSRALESNRFAAEYAARAVGDEIDHRFRSAEQLARNRTFLNQFESVLGDPEIAELRIQLSNPLIAGAEREEIKAQFLANEARTRLEQFLRDALKDPTRPSASSLFVTDENGLQLARAPQSLTVGENFAWRTYFHGGPTDHRSSWRAKSGQHIKETSLSRVFQSQSSNHWAVSISTPVRHESNSSGEADDDFSGVLGMSVEVRRFVDLQPGENQFAILVDWREGDQQGLILEHPLFERDRDEQLAKVGEPPKYYLTAEDLPDRFSRRENYIDPVSRFDEGKDFRQHWLAAMADVETRDGKKGWRVIVQQSYDRAIGDTLAQLKSSLLSSGLVAVAIIAALSTALWAFVLRNLGEPRRSKTPLAAGGEEPALPHSLATGEAGRG